MINKNEISIERQKIIDSTYPSRIVKGRQRKHIKGTKEFKQNRAKMQELSSGSEPAILLADAEELMNKYKGTGEIILTTKSLYPMEIIDADYVIGKTWVQSLQKYVETKRFRIVYSANGVHIIPVSDYERR